MRILRNAAVAALVALTTACSAGTGSADPSSPAPARQSRDRNIIGQAEIDANPGQNAYELVQRLRPRWLVVRGGTRSLAQMQTRIVVFSDNMQLEGIDALRQIPATTIASIRYMDGSTASNVLPGVGSGEHVSHAIVVTRLRAN
jgi:hypothetical protein